WHLEPRFRENQVKSFVRTTDELISLPEGTEPVIPPSFTDTATTGARITVRLQAAISLSPEAEMHGPSALPSPPLPPPLHMPPLIDRRDDILEIEMPLRKRLCLSTLGSRYEVGESFTDRSIRGQWIDYGIVSTLDAEARRRGIGEVDLLMKDNIAHQETIQIVEDEAYDARE
nr:hypothetical protein [Tanacetum cinerariifolium]